MSKHTALLISHNGSAIERIKISLQIQRRAAEGTTFISKPESHWHHCIPGLLKARPLHASCSTGTLGSPPEVPGYCYCRNGGGVRKKNASLVLGQLFECSHLPAVIADLKSWVFQNSACQ